MSLKRLSLKRFYDSDSDDILRDFYIPALSESVLYMRLTGFFSSTCLAVAAKGITRLLFNEGNMKLISGAKFRREDIEAIIDAYESPERIMEQTMLEELDNLENQFVKDHVRALGWMIAKGKLEIKIAIVYDENGYPIDERTVDERGIFHQKVGILEDIEGNQISFSGSDNESATGWQSNIEEFKVFRSWVEPEKKYFDADRKKFEKFWSGYPKRARVIDIPTAIKEKLIEIAPNDIDSLNLDKWLETRIHSRAQIRLRDYQKEAINNWLVNNRMGIFEMATGTGKTFAALGCLKKVMEDRNTRVVVIACPYNHLIRQWIGELKKFGITSEMMIADSTNMKWKDELTDTLLDIKNGILEKLIVLTTHDTFPSNDFIKILKGAKEKMFLIVDEVHGIGSPKRKTGLLEEYDWRLGLSATPKRWFDLEGTQKLYDYFKDVVFEFDLKKAIHHGYLCPYEYKPHFTELTDEEISRYQEETARIARAYYQTRDDEKKEEWFSLLCIRRQNIIKNAINKYNVLKKILREFGEIKHCLVYCNPEQIDTVQEILNDEDIIQHRFTQEEGTIPEEKYGGFSERKFLLHEFANGTYQVLVAMKCLDQGVDIPQAKTAIILANSGNPREYIQRRGRVLRRFPSKEKAIIHDIIVIPSLGSYSTSELFELERKIVAKELKRYKEFALVSMNAVECLKKIEKIETKYKIFV